MKKIISFFLALFTIFTSLSVPVFAEDSSAQPISTDDLTVVFFVQDNTATFVVRYDEDEATFSRIKITVELKKRNLLFFWNTIDQRDDASFENSSTITFNIPTGGSGTFRAYYTVSIYYTDGTVDTVEGYKE